MFWALKKLDKNSVLASETVKFEFPIDVLQAQSLLVEADVVTNLTWNSFTLLFTSQNSDWHALLGIVTVWFII